MRIEPRPIRVKPVERNGLRRFEFTSRRRGSVFGNFVEGRRIERVTVANILRSNLRELPHGVG
jgi:hypothetical protein